MSPEEFETLLKTGDLEDVADTVLLTGDAVHFSQEGIQIVVDALAAKFSVPKDEIAINIVGSAKLGFSILEKTDRNSGEKLPQFRSFSANSDIDVAVVSPAIFRAVWDELGRHADSALRMPWDSGKLGDYMIHGWLRPDHFPRNVRLRRCDDWWDVFRSLSANRLLGLRKIRGALYYSHDQLRRYQIRGLQNSRITLISKT